MAGNDSPCPCRPPAEQRRECSALVSQHRPFPPPVVASNSREQGEILLQRLDRARFQKDFHPFTRARAAAARYIVRTLRESLDTSLRGDADRPLRRSNGSRVPTGDAQGVKRRGHRPRGRNLIDFGKKAGEVPEGHVEL